MTSTLRRETTRSLCDEFTTIFDPETSSPALTRAVSASDLWLDSSSEIYAHSRKASFNSLSPWTSEMSRLPVHDVLDMSLTSLASHSSLCGLEPRPSTSQEQPLSRFWEETSSVSPASTSISVFTPAGSPCSESGDSMVLESPTPPLSPWHPLLSVTEATPPQELNPTTTAFFKDVPTYEEAFAASTFQQSLEASSVLRHHPYRRSNMSAAMCRSGPKDEARTAAPSELYNVAIDELLAANALGSLPSNFPTCLLPSSSLPSLSSLSATSTMPTEDETSLCECPSAAKTRNEVVGQEHDESRPLEETQEKDLVPLSGDSQGRNRISLRLLPPCRPKLTLPKPTKDVSGLKSSNSGVTRSMHLPIVISLRHLQHDPAMKATEGNEVKTKKKRVRVRKEAATRAPKVYPQRKPRAQPTDEECHLRSSLTTTVNLNNGPTRSRRNANSTSGSKTAAMLSSRRMKESLSKDNDSCELVRPLSSARLGSPMKGSSLQGAAKAEIKGRDSATSAKGVGGKEERGRQRLEELMAQQDKDGYWCELCPGEHFGRVHDLKRHQTSKHNDMTWPCDFCHRPFVRRDALLRHYSVKARRGDGIHPTNQEVHRLSEAKARAKLLA